MRIAFAVIAFAALFIQPLAPAPRAFTAAAEEKKEAKSGEIDRYIRAENVITPVVRNGRLANYLFVTVRVDLPEQGDVWKYRSRSHFLRDALLKAGHRTMLADAADDRKLNEAAALAVYRAAAIESLGAEAVKKVSIIQVQSLN